MFYKKKKKIKQVDIIWKQKLDVVIMYIVYMYTHMMTIAEVVNFALPFQVQCMSSLTVTWPCDSSLDLLKSEIKLHFISNYLILLININALLQRDII